MKKFLLFVALIAGLDSPLFAQSNVQTTQLQARWTGVTVADGKKCVRPGSYPITSHNFVFTVRKDTGTVSAILVTVTGSTDGTDPPVTSLATSTNTAGATITPTAAPYTNLCIALTSITGTGNPVIDVTYSGAAVGSGGAVTVGGNVATTVADGANVALGTTTDAKCTTSDATACTAIALLKELNGLAATDPCAGVLTTGADLHLASTTVTPIITAASAKKNYICSMEIVVGGTAEIVSLVEGTTAAACASPAVVWGSVTAASGFAFGANGGIMMNKTITGKSTNKDTCVQTSGSNAITVHVEYVQQ